MNAECSNNLMQIKKFVFKISQLIVGIDHNTCELKEMVHCHVGSEPKRGTFVDGNGFCDHHSS